MRLLSFVLTSVLGAALLSTTSSAEDEYSNIFKADLSNPDLRLAVKTFENVCMPFVLHKTELTRKFNRAHYKKQLENSGFVFQSQEKTEITYSLGPRKVTPEAALKANINKNCTFTVYNGVSSQVVESCETLVFQTGEVIGPAIPNIVTKTVDTLVETYGSQNNERLNLELGWNYPSQKYPGKSCKIKLYDSVITQADFIESFIGKDGDWQEGDDGWSQCVEDGADSFRFTANKNDSFSINLIRNDFFAPSVCGR